ncbi:2-acyl-glycerophospho-ethanolamine acyltransferase [compost metagenome]
MSSSADAATPPSSPPPARPSALAPLKHPIFRAVWITSLVTNFGGLIQSVGAAWMMTSIASAQMTALVQASVTLPIMLLSLAAGALADTVDRRKIMLAAQTFMLLVSTGLAAMTWMGWITPWCSACCWAPSGSGPWAAPCSSAGCARASRPRPSCAQRPWPSPSPPWASVTAPGWS